MRNGSHRTLRPFYCPSIISILLDRMVSVWSSLSSTPIGSADYSNKQCAILQYKYLITCEISWILNFVQFYLHFIIFQKYLQHLDLVLIGERNQSTFYAFLVLLIHDLFQLLILFLVLTRSHLCKMIYKYIAYISLWNIDYLYSNLSSISPVRFHCQPYHPNHPLVFLSICQPLHHPICLSVSILIVLI